MTDIITGGTTVYLSLIDKVEDGSEQVNGFSNSQRVALTEEEIRRHKVRGERVSLI